jgi:DNA-binding transcriptional LysR family regulator
MRRSSLPLNGLRAFEAAARHLSFTRAADEMSVTQAAVSHQVKALERRLGVTLFRRLPRALLLTDEGQSLLPELRASFNRIAQALERISAQEGSAALTVSLMTTFALTWLVPRLPRFQAAHPEIEVRLMTTPRVIDFAREDVDVAIRFGDGHWPNQLITTKLLDDALTPLCGRAHRERLRRPGDLRGVTLLHAGDDEWAIWLAAVGVRGINARKGPTFDSTKIAVQAAIDGLGVAAGDPHLFADDIAAGRLFQPFPLIVSNPGKGYWLVYPEASAERAKVKAFCDWIVAEAAPRAGRDSASNHDSPSDDMGRDAALQHVDHLLHDG